MLYSITIEQYHNLKELGCNLERCDCGGFPECICIEPDKRPYQEDAKKWLRENKNIHIEIYANASGWGWILTKTAGNGSIIKEIQDDIFFETYEIALHYGINECIKYVY